MRIKAVLGLWLALAMAGSSLAAEPSNNARDEAIHCAALETFLSALLSASSRRQPSIEVGLRKASTRWLEYAATLPPKDPIAVMDAYLTYNREHYDPLLKAGGPDPDETRERLGVELQACEEAEQRQFGSTFRNLAS